MIRFVCVLNVVQNAVELVEFVFESVDFFFHGGIACKKFARFGFELTDHFRRAFQMRFRNGKFLAFVAFCDFAFQIHKFLVDFLVLKYLVKFHCILQPF